MDKLIKLKSAKPFEIRCKSETRAEITIYEEIGEGGFFYDSLSAKEFNKQLKTLPDTVNQIDVRINSPGGDVFDGITIYNRLKQHKAKVTVYVDGLAASIASIIALAGDEIIMSEGAMVMIHKPWTVAVGDSSSLQETIDRLDDVEEQLLSIYQRKTGLDRSELRQMLSGETWMDAEQAIDLGFADKVSQEESAPIAASLKDKAWINKTPRINDENKLINEKVNGFKNDVKDYLARKK